MFAFFKASARRFHASKELEIEGMAEAAKGAAARAKALGEGSGFRRSFGSLAKKTPAGGEAMEATA